MIPFLLTLLALALVAFAAWCVREMGKEMGGLGDEKKDEDRTEGQEP